MNAPDEVGDSEDERDKIDETSSSVSNVRDRNVANDEERIKQALLRSFDIDVNFRFSFPENFAMVPSVESANKIWRKPMDYRDLARRLRKEHENTGPNEIPESIFLCFEETVEFARGKVASVQHRLRENEHHTEVLSRAKANGKIPRFLQLEVPRVCYFEEESRKSIENTLRQKLEKASTEMLDCILNERNQLKEKLIQEAEQLSDELRTYAMEKWMEFQDSWNGWDHLYPVEGIFRNSENGSQVCRLIPLSTVVFRTAMEVCRTLVSTHGEAKRLEKAEITRSRKTEDRLRKEALAKVSAAPRQEAEKSIEQRMQDLLQPISTRLGKIEEKLEGNPSSLSSAREGGEAVKKPAKRSRESDANPGMGQHLLDLLKPLQDQISHLEEQLRGNPNAPMTAGTCGAASMSAQRSRSMEANQDASRDPQHASDPKKGTKKRLKGSEKARRDNEDSTLPQNPGNQSQARKPAFGKGNKPWKYRNRFSREGKGQ